MLRVIFAKKTLWITLKKFHFFESVEKVFNLLSRIQQKRVQFFESYQKKEFNSFSSILWVKFHSVSKKRFNSVSHIQKKSSILWVKFKKLILWVIFWKKFISWSQIWKMGPILFVIFEQMGPILFVIFEQKVQLFASCQRNLTVQFIASYSRKESNSLVIFKEKGFNSVSRTEKKQFLEWN